jgi:hypothetical protein
MVVPLRLLYLIFGHLLSWLAYSATQPRPRTSSAAGRGARVVRGHSLGPPRQVRPGRSGIPVAAHIGLFAVGTALGFGQLLAALLSLVSSPSLGVGNTVINYSPEPPDRVRQAVGRPRRGFLGSAFPAPQRRRRNGGAVTDLPAAQTFAPGD